MKGAPSSTKILRAHAAGDRATVTRLFPAFYDELRRLAHRQLVPGDRGRPRTLNTTALVHEAYIKLGGSGLSVGDRAHFFALAARAMRQIIIDDARQHKAEKRGGGIRPVTLDGNSVAIDEEADQLLAVDDALSQLEALDERLARVVECRFFAGLTESETSEALSVSLRTVQRDWLRARALLRGALEP